MDDVKIRRFYSNGYGVSIVRHVGTYGAKVGLFELAVLKGTESKANLCYDTPITNDVIGNLTTEEAEAIALKVSQLLPPVSDFTPDMLRQFTGTEMYHPLGSLNMSDGAAFVHAHCPTLTSAILSRQIQKNVSELDMQFWTWTPANGGRLTCREDDGIPFVVDMPLDLTVDFQIDMWVANGVLYLPSEH